MKRPEETTQPLERWESWPLWALGLSNGLNIVVWYVVSMARVQTPELPIEVYSALAHWLPFVAVLGGVSQVFALDGSLVATIAGARHGRRGPWTWVTIVFTGLFSAAISYALHSGKIDQLPALHVASAINMIFYNLHLAQKKGLTPVAGSASAVNRAELISTAELAEIAAARPSAEDLAEQGTYPSPVLSHQPKLRACKYCGEMLPISTLGSHGRNFKRWGNCRRL